METIKSVTVFLNFKGKYLLLKRRKDADIFPRKLTGVGGRVELNETFVDAAIRETEEETGISLGNGKLRFSGIFTVKSKNNPDWFIVYFKADLDDKDEIFELNGFETDEGELIWFDIDKILENKGDLVDDLHYCFEDLKNDIHFFVSAERNEKGKFIDVKYSSI